MSCGQFFTAQVILCLLNMLSTVRCLILYVCLVLVVSGGSVPPVREWRGNLRFRSVFGAGNFPSSSWLRGSTPITLYNNDASSRQNNTHAIHSRNTGEIFF